MAEKCVICGEVFDTIWKLYGHLKKVHKLTAKEYYDKFFKKPEEGKCLCCGKPTKLRSIKDGYTIFCSSKCSHTPPFNPFCTKKFKKKKMEHDRKKFGCDFSTQNEEIKKKIVDALHRRSANLLQQKLQPDNSHITVVNHDKSDVYKLHCSVCNNEFELRHNFIYNRISRHQNVCPYCCPTEILMSSSIYEKQMVTEIKKIYKGKVLTNDRTAIKPRELDAYLPDLRLGFEFDGYYFHADPRFFKETDFIGKKGKTAKEIWEDDKAKDLMCENAGIKLVRINEYDWKKDKENCIKNMEKIINTLIEYTQKEV